MGCGIEFVVIKLRVVCHAGKDGIQMTESISNSQMKDSSSKLIFSDPILCAQFLRGYVDIPLLRDVQPEDIEDVTGRYLHMFAEERNSDSVSRVKTKMNETPFFIVSLIEHKSNVDYNVVMQVFRYMVFIWEDYEKEMEKQHKGISKTKDFRYPPILPIVFYDGADNWTASDRLHDRILFSDVFGRYIPDYRCMLIKLSDYTNAELMEKKDELSVIMMVDRLRNAADYKKMIQEVSSDYLQEVTAQSPDYLLEIMAQIVEVFLAKLNIPLEEVDTFTSRIKERNMGELFAHFEGWDVQAIRKESFEQARKVARKEVQEELQREIESARKEVMQQVTEQVTQQVTEQVTQQITESDIQKLLTVLHNLGCSREDAIEQLMEQYQMTYETAAAKADNFWKDEK